MINLDNPKRELAYVIFSQKWKIVALTLVCTLVAVYVSFLWPPTYGAYGTLLVKSSKIQKNIEALEATDLRARPVSKEDLYSEISILTTNEVLQRAMDRVREDEVFGDEWLEVLGTNDVKRLKNLRRSLVAEVVPTSNVINIELTGAYPEFTRRMLSEILDQYIRYRLEVYNPERAAAFLGGQLTHFREELAAKNRQLLFEVEQSGVTLADRQIDYNLQVKRELATRKQDLETQAMRLSQLIQRIEAELERSEVQFFSFVDNPTIQALGTSLQTLITDHHAKAQMFLSARKEVYESNEHIIRAYSTLKKEVRAYMLDKKSELASMRRSIGQLNERIEGIEDKNLQIKRGKLKLEDIERDLALLRSSYETFFVRNEEALTASNPEIAFLNSHVSILTPATAYDKALSPLPERLIPLGIIAGLLLGLSLGFLYEYFDHTFKRPEEVQKVLGVPVLFSLNYNTDLNAKGLRGSNWLRASSVAILVLLVGIGGLRIYKGQLHSGAGPTGAGLDGESGLAQGGYARRRAGEDVKAIATERVSVPRQGSGHANAGTRTEAASLVASSGDALVAASDAPSRDAVVRDVAMVSGGRSELASSLSQAAAAPIDESGPSLGEHSDDAETATTNGDHDRFVAATPTQRGSDALVKAIEEWRQAWSDRDNERYLSYYAADFDNGEMDLAQWKAYKNHVNSAKSFIDVKVSLLSLEPDPDDASTITARFLQEYASNTFVAKRWKMQVWRRDEQGKWRIRYEGSPHGISAETMHSGASLSFADR